MLDTKKILQETVSRLLETRPDVSRLDLSRLMEVSDGALGRIKYGNGNPTAETLERIARFFRVEPWQLLVPGFDPAKPPQLAQTPVLAAREELPAGYVRFELLDVVVSAGHGAFAPQHHEILQHIDVLESWARQTLGTADPEWVKLVVAKGDSMAPTIQNGDIIFVDTRHTQFESDGIYTMDWQGRTLVKRLRMLTDGRMAIQSDNQVAYPPEYVTAATASQLVISGLVLGWWALRRF